MAGRDHLGVPATSGASSMLRGEYGGCAKMGVGQSHTTVRAWRGGVEGGGDASLHHILILFEERVNRAHGSCPAVFLILSLMTAR